MCIAKFEVQIEAVAYTNSNRQDRANIRKSIYMNTNEENWTVDII